MKISDLKNITSKWQVEIDVGADIIEFTGVFNILDDASLESVKDDDIRFISAVLIGWEGIEDENGEPLAFSSDNLRFLSGNPIVRSSIINAYYSCLGDGVLKNLKRQHTES